MSIAEIWDRFWWSLMLTVFLGLVWLKFVDPIFPNIIVGIIVSCAIGTAYFIRGIRKILKIKRHEKEIEQKAYEELVAEFGKEGAVR